MITFCPDPVPQVRKEKKPAGNSVRKVISDAGKEQTLVPRNPKARKEKRILCLRLEREEETGIGCQTVSPRDLVSVSGFWIHHLAQLIRDPRYVPSSC